MRFDSGMVPKLLELLQPPEGAEGDAITIQLTDKEKTPAATPKLPAGDASPLSPKSQGSPMSRAATWIEMLERNGRFAAKRQSCAVLVQF